MHLLNLKRANVKRKQTTFIELNAAQSSSSSYEAIDECFTEMLAEYRDEPVTSKRNNIFSEFTMKNQQIIMIWFWYISLNKADTIQKDLDIDHFKQLACIQRKINHGV